MKCTEIDFLLCDYLDATLDAGRREAVERHLSTCQACAELARDAGAAVGFLSRVEPMEAPPELITRILFHTARSEMLRAAPRPVRALLPRWLTGWLQPVLQPRFAMGMAMTILSFSMIGRFAGIPQRQLTPADLDPVKIWSTIDAKAHRAWDRAVKYYQNLRLVFEIESRLSEWSVQEEQERKPQGSGAVQTRGAGAEAPPGGDVDKGRQSK